MKGVTFLGSCPMIREVWSQNLQEELALLNENLSEFPVVSIDTEFPGFLRCTSKGIPEEEFYEAVKYNVDRLNVLQIGLTLADESGNIAMTWEFNFRGFDEINDVEGVPLDSFLKNKGFDFDRLYTDGIEPEEFARQFFPICRSGRIARWITFHGFYDIAYLLKLLRIQFMPNTMAKFAAMARHLLGTVSDLKHMARHCDGLLNGELGLKRLAKLLDVERIGIAHHAGSDSLLTACVYAEMKEVFELPPEECEGFLYGLRYRIGGPRKEVKIVDPSSSPLWSYYMSSCSRSPFVDFQPRSGLVM